MKTILQHSGISILIVGALSLFGGKNVSAQTCTNPITSYPTTVNGVTIEYYGDASFSPPRTPITCGQSAPPISQFYGNGTTLTAGSYVFSSPVNDIVFWVGGMHDIAAYGAPEKFSWSTNGGNTSVTSSNYCMGILSGSTFTSSGSSSTTGTNTAGGFFTVHADSPFTSVTLIHTQGNSALNGASVLLYYGSVVPSPALSAVTQPTCTTATGSFTISNYDPALTYTITPSGTTRSGAVVTVPAGAGPYSVTASNGTCSSATVQSGNVDAQPSNAAPVISAIDPTCSEITGSVSVNSPVSGVTYTLSPGGATSTIGTFPGLAAGSGPYSVTSTSSGCTSAASNSVSIGAAATGCAGVPDLTVTILNDGTALPAGVNRDNVISITNLGGVTTDVIVVNVPKMAPNFTVTIPPDAMSMNVSGSYTVDNASWVIVEQATRFVLTSKTGVTIPANGTLHVGVTVQASGLPKSSGNLSARIVFGTGGGETPTSNNDDNNTYTVN